MQLLIWKLPRLYGSAKPRSPDISGNLLASQSCFGYRSAAHHADSVIRVDLLGGFAEKGSDLPVPLGLLGGLKGLFCFVEGKPQVIIMLKTKLPQNHLQNRPEVWKVQPRNAHRGAAVAAPLRLRAAIRAKPARIRLQPSSGRTPPEAPGRPWWWGRRRRLRSGSRTGERWPCACRSRSSRAPPASSCARPAPARPC